MVSRRQPRGFERQLRDPALGRRNRPRVTELQRSRIRDHVPGCSRDGNVVVSATSDGEVWIWELDRDVPLHKLKPHSAWMETHVALSPDDKVLATAGGDDGQVKLFDLATAKELRSWRASPDAVTAVAFTPDGSLIATGDAHRVAVGDWDKHSVDFHDPLTGRELKKFQLGITGGVGAVACSPDGRLVAACSGRWSNAAVHVIDLANDRQLFLLKHDFGGVSSLAFAPDGKTLATAGEGNRRQTNHVCLWSMTDGAELARLAPEAHAQDPPLYGPRRQLAFSPDGKVLAVTGRDGAVRLLDVQTRRELRRLDGQQGGVWRIAFSPGTSLLATAGSDTTVLLWPTRVP